MNNTIPSVFCATCYRISSTRRGFSGGVSLVEVLVVMLVMGILVSIVAPAMTATMGSAKLNAASDTFLTAMHLARSEAISRTDSVVMCKSANGLSCSLTGSWEQGWIIFRDANHNGQREATEALVTQQSALSAGLKLTGNLTVAKYVSFSPTGSAKLIGGGFQAGTLTLCKQSPGGGEARQFVLNVAGRVRVHKVAVVSCA
jgi:type IV fimbrial biogenesis protein FimT